MATAQSSAFQHPPSLMASHLAELKKRGISEAFAIASGVRTTADNESRALNFQASIPVDQRHHGMHGIAFEYRSLDGSDNSTWRIKPDTHFSIGGQAAKYISLLGDKPRCYFPHTTTAEQASNPKVNVVITEGEFKTLAIAECIVPICSRPTCVIGLQGVNGGWHRDKIVVPLPDGTKETRKEGHAHLIDDLEAWDWKKRVVYICFDSDVGTKRQAEEFKRNKRSGAWGAEYTLSQLLRAKGADVRIVMLPAKLDGTKYGADDFICEHDPHAFLKLLYNNWVIERDVDETLYRQDPAAIRIESAQALVARAPKRPEKVIDKILPVGCVAVIAGAAGIGKSFVQLNACQAVATGNYMLDYLATEAGKVLYIQTEMPAWALAERIKGMGNVSDNLLVWSPGSSFPLNFWEPDGYNKRRETGNRERVMALLDQIKSHAPRLVCFDPLKDFTSLPLTDPDATKHLFQIFRLIAQHARCGIMLGHHHKKVGGREAKYEGMDDAYGAYIIQAEADSILSMYLHTRADGTCRTKLLFSKLRHAPPMDPLEIERLSQDDCLAWRAIPWKDHTGEMTDADRLIEALEGGPLSYTEAVQRSGLAKTSFYRTFEKLESGKICRREGNLYYLTANFAQ